MPWYTITKTIKKICSCYLTLSRFLSYSLNLVPASSWPMSWICGRCKMDPFQVIPVCMLMDICGLSIQMLLASLSRERYMQHHRIVYTLRHGKLPFPRCNFGKVFLEILSSHNLIGIHWQSNPACWNLKMLHFGVVL